jgi:hypothetical protein
MYAGAFTKQVLPWKSNKYYTFWACVRSLSYRACNAHAPYYIVICSLSATTIFFHITHKRHDFRGKKFLNIKCFFLFSLQLLSKTLLILRIIQWDTAICVKTSSRKKLFILVGFLLKLHFSRQVFGKNSTFMKIRPVGTHLFDADGRTRQTCGRFSQFCERA